MKKSFLSLILLVCLSAGIAQAQNHSKWGAEIHTTPMSIHFGDKNGINVSGFGIGVVYTPIQNLSLKLGAESVQLRQNNTKTFDHISMLRLGAGYTFYRNALSSYELNISAGNDMNNNFTKFANFDVSADVRMKLRDAFYFGIGVKHLQLKKTDFATYPKSNTNVYFSLGYAFSFGK